LTKESTRRKSRWQSKEASGRGFTFRYSHVIWMMSWKYRLRESLVFKLLRWLKSILITFE
jgi:hypothetical protein